MLSRSDRRTRRGERSRFSRDLLSGIKPQGEMRTTALVKSCLRSCRARKGVCETPAVQGKCGGIARPSPKFLLHKEASKRGPAVSANEQIRGTSRFCQSPEGGILKIGHRRTLTLWLGVQIKMAYFFSSSPNQWSCMISWKLGTFLKRIQYASLT